MNNIFNDLSIKRDIMNYHEKVNIQFICNNFQIQKYGI